MTFWAKQSDSPLSKRVEVHVTSGPISITVEEDPGHLRSFWGELGRLLEAVETKEAEAEVLWAVRLSRS